jgi:ribonuclease Y
MMEIVIAVVALGVGVLIGRYLLKRIFLSWEKDAKLKAGQIVEEAKMKADNIKEKRMLEAKEKYLKLKTDFESDTNRKKNQLANQENKLKQLESKLKQNESKLKQKEVQLAKQQ